MCLNANRLMCMVQVPEVNLEWHPFSLASGSLDKFVELQVGVIGAKSKEQWRQPQAKEEETRQLLRGGRGRSALSSIMPPIPATKWEMHARPTWTYLVQEALRKRITTLSFLDDPERQSDHVEPLRCRLRG